VNPACANVSRTVLSDRRVLVVDDEVHIVELLTSILEEEGYEVIGASSAEEALAYMEQYAVPLVVSDIRMGGMSGLELVGEIKKINSSAEIIIITSHASIESAVSALRAGAYDYVLKPFDDIEVISMAVKRAYEKSVLVKENADLLDQLSEFNIQLVKANNRLKNLVNRDGLTGAYNHRYFQEALNQEFVRAKRYGKRFSVVFVDLDDFKQINDTYGHLVGDQVLVAVTKLITKSVRDVDLVARYGGEEFVLLLPETSDDGAMACAEGIRKLLSELEITNEHNSIRITISSGVALVTDNCDSAQDVVQRADAALYQAKKMGKNKVCAAK